MSAAVTLDNVTLSYQRHPAVHHVSGEFATGSLTAVTGPNGAGKSTLLKAIAGLHAPNAGHIRRDPAQRLAYLPQTSELQRDFPLTVLAMVATGFWYNTGGWRGISSVLRKQALAALAQVGLAGFGGRDLASLSAGQFQRALFARLLVQDAPLILLDEPFAAIDTDTTAQLLVIIERWHRERRTVICVLHDIEQIRRHFPQCLLLARECIGWGYSIDVLKPDMLHKARFFHDGWNSHPVYCERSA